MSDKLDDFVDQLQEQIYDEAKTALGTKGFERWLNPRYRGIIKNPDGYASITGACGDTMQIFLKLENERVTDATYQTDGCGSSTVCGSFGPIA
jgi:nitrogen fixation NifU-like protein